MNVVQKVVTGAPAIAIVLTVLGLLAYAVALCLAAFAPDEWPRVASLKSWFMGNAAANIGIPCSAIASFAVVAVLLTAFPPDKQGGTLKLKVFGLEFSGPGGPITLWLMCFLGFVFSLKLLRLTAN